MAKHESYEQKAESMITPILEENGLSLVDVEYVKEAGQWYLRFYIDKEGGVNINDCETVSRAMSALLDQDDFIEDAYILEVSSPGLGRPLKKEKDFIRNTGREIELKLYKAEDGTREFMGTLTAFTKENITVAINGEEKVFERKNIALIREYVDWDE